ncbi:integrase-like protein [Rhizobium azibense]|uniref:Integrase-like protein n=1 Tax=Rhizobium azibense TaxID=1136135 RepID=A0A4R3QV83_9HYPH|nr:integrase-like protein [Rhizobium azibense]
MPACRVGLQQRGVENMSRKGSCLNNAAMQGFIAILSSEFLRPIKFAGVQSPQSRITDTIRHHDNDRIKMKLKGPSPLSYRTQPSIFPAFEPSNLMGSVQQAGFFDKPEGPQRSASAASPFLPRTMLMKRRKR